MINTETIYAGLKLRNPLIIGSSGLTKSAAANKKLEDMGASAIVLKSLFEEQIELQGDEMLAGTDAPEAADYIRNYVKANALENYLNLISETKAQCSIPVIASINCYKSSAWVEFAEKIAEVGADALELNIFYLCTDPKTPAADLYNLYISILDRVCRRISIPVTVKIGKCFGNIPGLVDQLKAHGAKGVVMFNRYYRPDIDIEKLQITSGDVFGNPSDLSDTLRWTAIVSGFVPGISIASSNGVFSHEDVIKCLLAGASAVQLCSVVYKNGPEIIRTISNGLEEWIEAKKYRTIADFQGKLSFSNVSNPSMYERSQFMRYYSDRK